MRRSPLLIFLLSITLHIDVSADELVAQKSAQSFDGSSVVSTQAVAAKAVRNDNQFAGPALEPSSTIAGTFDYSYYLVLSLGIAGLIWMRRQSQSL